MSVLMRLAATPQNPTKGILIRLRLPLFAAEHSFNNHRDQCRIQGDTNDYHAHVVIGHANSWSYAYHLGGHGHGTIDGQD